MGTPSPFPARTYPSSTLFLYVDGVDLTPWANRNDLQEAENVYQQGVAETFRVRLRHTSEVNPLFGMGPQPLPTIREGMLPVIYLARYGTGASDYMHLASGQVETIDVDEEALEGSSIMQVSTPIKMLKHQLRAVRFWPQTTANDKTRLSALGHKWGRADFDFTLPTYTPSITYQSPRIYWDGVYFVSPEPDMSYENRTVYDIIMDICADPGSPQDTDYPVPDRMWYITARFVDDTNPSLGIIWVLNVSKPQVPGYYGTDLVDVDDGSGIPYEKATIKTDYRTVIRRVTVAGHEFGLPGSVPRADYFAASGTTPAGNIYNFANGWVRKVAGVDGSWDTSAVGNYIIWQDQDFHFQVTETYLVHDPFQGDDNEVLEQTSLADKRDPGFPEGLWYYIFTSTYESNHNVMRVYDKVATPRYAYNDAISLVDAKAATCITYATIGQNAEGAAVFVRANQSSLPDFLLNSSYLVRTVGSTYELQYYDGSSYTTLGTGGTAASNDVIKVFSKLTDATHLEIQVFVNNTMVIQVDSLTNNLHDTWCGIGQLDGGSGFATRVTFKDFAVTSHFADRAIGVGAEGSPAEAGHPDWTWIGHGIVFNVNGTFTLIRGGTIVDTLGVGDYGQTGAVYTYADLNTYQAGHGGLLPADVPYTWADVQLAHNTQSTGYQTDDVGRLTIVRYQDTDGTAKWKVQTWYQVGGDGEDILLREQLALPDNTFVSPFKARPADPTFWYHQVALKELGATFVNVGATDNYSNVFIAPPSLAVTPLVGDFPATAVIQNDFLNTYALRQRIADGVFRTWAEPHITMQCDVQADMSLGGSVAQPPVQRGQWVRVKNTRAGWVSGGTDTRKNMLVRSVQRKIGGVQGRHPMYTLRLGSAAYDLTDPARVHLLQPDPRTYVPRNLEVPDLAGVAYYFQDTPDPDQYYGDRVEVQVNEVGHPPLPSFWLPAGTFSFELPAGTFKPGALFESRHRTWSGQTPSTWSSKYPGTMPNAGAYPRPYTVNLPIGNGSTNIALQADLTGSQELQINEGAAIVAWSLVFNGVVNLTIEVWHATNANRVANGLAAYTKISGTNPPYCMGSDNGRTGADFRYWDDVRASLAAGDWLCCKVSWVGYAFATSGTLSLTLSRNTGSHVT